MTSAQARFAIRRLVSEGRIRVTGHATMRMAERDISYDSLVNALLHMRNPVFQPWNGRWRCKGPGLSGQVVEPVVVLEENAVVVSLWDPNRKDA